MQKLNQEALDQMVQTIVHTTGKNSTTGKTRPTMWWGEPNVKER